MRYARALCLIGIAGLLASGNTAEGAMERLGAVLTEAAEIPPAPNPNGVAEGLAFLEIDTDTREFTIQVLFTGIDTVADPLTGAHIHVGNPAFDVAGVPFTERTGPVIVNLDHTLFVRGGNVQSRTFSGVFPEMQLADLLAGNTYVNIHTVSNPAGQIRGQLVPEPATLGLLTVGLAAGVVSWRRRRR